MQFPITIGLHRSSFRALAVAAAHALALAAVLSTAWPAPAKFAMAAAALASAVRAWKKGVPAVEALRIVDPGRLECRLAGEASFVEARVDFPAFVHPWLVVLPLEAAGRRIYVALWPDGARAEDLRCLRVWLRWRIRDEDRA